MQHSNPRRLFTPFRLGPCGRPLGLRCSATAGPPTPATGRGADLHYGVSWIGNSFGGKTTWVQQDVEGLWVEPDGTVFTNVRWDEAGGNVQQYHDGQLVAMAGHTHGWGYEGGDAVAANSKYLFIVQNVEQRRRRTQGELLAAQGLHLVGCLPAASQCHYSGCALPRGTRQAG